MSLLKTNVFAIKIILWPLQKIHNTTCSLYQTVWPLPSPSWSPSPFCPWLHRQLAPLAAAPLSWPAVGSWSWDCPSPAPASSGSGPSASAAPDDGQTRALQCCICLFINRRINQITTSKSWSCHFNALLQNLPWPQFVFYVLHVALLLARQSWPVHPQPPSSAPGSGHGAVKTYRGKCWDKKHKCYQWSRLRCKGGFQIKNNAVWMKH